MNRVKIAIVIPYLHKMEGNKTALLLASQLMKGGNDVSLIIWKIKSSIYENLIKKYPGLKIKYHFPSFEGTITKSNMDDLSSFKIIFDNLRSTPFKS